MKSKWFINVPKDKRIHYKHVSRLKCEEQPLLVRPLTGVALRSLDCMVHPHPRNVFFFLQTLHSFGPLSPFSVRYLDLALKCWHGPDILGSLFLWRRMTPWCVVCHLLYLCLYLYLYLYMYLYLYLYLQMVFSSPAENDILASVACH